MYEFETRFFQTPIYHDAINKQGGCNHQSSTIALKGPPIEQSPNIGETQLAWLVNILRHTATTLTPNGPHKQAQPSSLPTTDKQLWRNKLTANPHAAKLT